MTEVVHQTTNMQRKPVYKVIQMAGFSTTLDRDT